MGHKGAEKRPVRLTNKFVDQLTGKDMWWDDDPKATGFGVRSYPGGGKSFFIDYRLNGRQRRYTIGPFPRWSAEAAREQAKKLRKEIDQGIDPAGDKRARRNAPTIQDLIDRYIKDHLPKKSITGHRVKDEKLMLAVIGDRLGKHTKVADIHGGDIADMHHRITASGRPVRANRILAICSKMFSLSLVPLAGETLPWRNAAAGNPCKGVQRNREEAKERFFSQSELTAISDALAKYQSPAADCVRLTMLTGCRPVEAIKAQWEEFDREPGFWVKPSSHLKQRKVHKLPLNPAALELIERLRKKRKGKWVFPGDKPGEHLTSLWRVWHFVRKETGLGKDARLYDLRHTFASVGAGGGLSLPIIGRLLGHTQPRTTQRYAHLADDPLREATEKIGAVITGKGKGAAVVQLRGERS
ncbi:MAG TPA: site-specific integrase [Xanthobacteraceae bacterium]|jgi:integrase|nr:site-specific integrase [Xanthobacteraceae bacterium]